MGEADQSLLAQAGVEVFFCCQNYVPSLASQRLQHLRCYLLVPAVQLIETEERDQTLTGHQKTDSEVLVDVPSGKVGEGVLTSVSRAVGRALLTGRARSHSKQTQTPCAEGFCQKVLQSARVAYFVACGIRGSTRCEEESVGRSKSERSGVGSG
jgi:hypothetical protein